MKAIVYDGLQKVECRAVEDPGIDFPAACGHCEFCNKGEYTGVRKLQM